jgi:hypothetical protein
MMGPSMQTTRKHTRRTALSLVGVTTLAAAAPAVAMAAEDPHIAWATEAAELRLQALNPGLSDNDSGDLFEQAWACEDLICAAPATTLAGVACQLRVLLVQNETGSQDEHVAAGLENALATVLRLGRGA